MLWKVNPRGAFLLFNKNYRRMDYIWCNSTFIGFSDGAWKLKSDGSISCGIGGCITDLKGNLLFIFFGQGHARSPLEAKMEALLFLFLKIKENSQLSRIYTICTDSKLLEEIFIKGSDGYSEEEMLEFNSD